MKRKGGFKIGLANNKPIQCCILEYGIKDEMGEWIQLHKVVDTTIKN
jgi:hypothetical protein